MRYTLIYKNKVSLLTLKYLNKIKKHIITHNEFKRTDGTNEIEFNNCKPAYLRYKFSLCERKKNKKKSIITNSRILFKFMSQELYSFLNNTFFCKYNLASGRKSFVSKNYNT